MLTLIDCFSKKAYAAPLKHKTVKHVKSAMESILPDNVKHLQTDEGKEFFNKDFKELMKKRSITHYHTYSYIKASIVDIYRENEITYGHFLPIFTLILYRKIDQKSMEYFCTDRPQIFSIF